MHDHISIAYNSKRSTGMKLILVLFESYRVEDFFGFKKPLPNIKQGYFCGQSLTSNFKVLC